MMQGNDFMFVFNTRYCMLKLDWRVLKKGRIGTNQLYIFLTVLYLTALLF